jgi:hypothetical protein
LFELCSIKGNRCPFAGKYKNNVHCGLEKGDITSTMVSNMKKCPWKPKKRGRR